MGHAIYIYQKSFSTLLHCFMHEWYFIGFRICWSHLEDVFIFSSLELICFLHAVYLVLSLSQPSFQFIACLYAYSYLSVSYKNTLEKNHIHIFKKQIFLSLYKTGGEEGWANEGALQGLGYSNFDVFSLICIRFLVLSCSVIILLWNSRFLFSKWH